MAWSRFSLDSSIYTFPSESDGVGVLECCACPLIGDLGSFRTQALQPFLVHLEHHRAAGHTVPDYLGDLIAEEAWEYLGPVGGGEA